MWRWKSTLVLCILAQHQGVLALSNQCPKSTTNIVRTSENFDSIEVQGQSQCDQRRRFLSAAGMATITGFAKTPWFANAATVPGGSNNGRNKQRLGGLASKIRGVCNSMVSWRPTRFRTLVVK